MKKSFLFSSLLVATMFSASLTMSSCGGSKSETQEQTTDEAPAESTDVAEAKYACPMHPEITGKKGDTCSKCNMALEEVKDETDSTEMEHDHH